MRKKIKCESERKIETWEKFRTKIKENKTIFGTKPAFSNFSLTGWSLPHQKLRFLFLAFLTEQKRTSLGWLTRQPQVQRGLPCTGPRRI